MEETEKETQRTEEHEDGTTVQETEKERSTTTEAPDNDED